MALSIQDFLRQNPDGIKLLKEQLGIDAKRHKEFPNLISFKYNQIDSPAAHPIVQEARGIILDEADDWNVVAMGFKRFYNVSEPQAAPINWLRAHVQEKVDGSLILLFWYKDAWRVATSGTPDASGEVNDFCMTFADLFWKVAKEQNVRFEWLNPTCTWIFELTTPYNRVVVEHKNCKIWLLGTRDNRTLQESLPDPITGKNCNLFVPTNYHLTNLGDCLKAAEALPPTEHEGFVVVDNKFNRVKIKSPAYVMLHHAKDSLSIKRMCEVVRKGEYQEFSTAIESFPELKKIFYQVSLAYCNMKDGATEWYSKLKDIKEQKEFALAVMDSPAKAYSSILFSMRKSGLSAGEILASPKMSIDCFMNMAGLKT